MLPPLEHCTHGLYEPQMLCLQAYVAEGVYLERTDGLTAFMGAGGPALTVVLVAMVAVMLAKWRR